LDYSNGYFQVESTADNLKRLTGDKRDQYIKFTIEIRSLKKTVWLFLENWWYECLVFRIQIFFLVVSLLIPYRNRMTATPPAIQTVADQPTARPLTGNNLDSSDKPVFLTGWLTILWGDKQSSDTGAVGPVYRLMDEAGNSTVLDVRSCNIHPTETYYRSTDIV